MISRSGMMGIKSYINESGTGSLFIDSSALFLQNVGQTKLQVTGSGINVTGVVTATSFVGDGSGLTNLPSGGGGGTPVVVPMDKSNLIIKANFLVIITSTMTPVLTC